MLGKPGAGMIALEEEATENRQKRIKFQRTVLAAASNPQKGPLLLAPVSLLAPKLTKGLPRGIPWWCSGWDSMLSLPGPRFNPWLGN